MWEEIEAKDYENWGREEKEKKGKKDGKEEKGKEEEKVELRMEGGKG